MKLTTWIEKNGGNGPTGALLGIARNNVYAWGAGVALPRPAMMKRIVELTRGKVSYAEMVEEFVHRKLIKKLVVGKKKAPKKPAKKKGVGRGNNSPPAVMKRVIAHHAKMRKKKMASKDNLGF